MNHSETPALKQQWVLDTTWTDCPLDVKEVVKGVWSWQSLGNDHYMFRTTLADFKAFDTDAYNITHSVWEGSRWVEKPLVFKPLIDYLVSKGVKDEDQVILHYWW